MNIIMKIMSVNCGVKSYMKIDHSSYRRNFCSERAAQKYLLKKEMIKFEHVHMWSLLKSIYPGTKKINKQNHDVAGGD